MAEEESDESSFKLRRWQRRNLTESASSFVHGCGARQWLEELIGSSIAMAAQRRKEHGTTGKRSRANKSSSSFFKLAVLGVPTTVAVEVRSVRPNALL
ncbi:hypothetical protein TorRG33x02_196550 [Trema orientale]|uniref:Uncharacterized protein n=1 Tax=Trema orientale TaxID=63057 RepID=A0A2P5EGB9_TREOI|nr:hypothetical protein TorRG33x02_196550 [Trema orientale]